jgi:hypothetical protein
MIERHTPARIHPVEDHIDKERELVGRANRRQLGDCEIETRTPVRGVNKQRMRELKISRQEDVSRSTGGKRRRDRDMIKAQRTASLEMRTPRSGRTHHQRMQIVDATDGISVSGGQ